MGRILIYGGNSLPGFHLAAGLKNRHEVFTVDSDPATPIVGIRNLKGLPFEKSSVKAILQRYKPDLVIYALGVHGEGANRSSPKLAANLNQKAAGTVLEMTDRIGKCCVLLSNAYAAGSREARGRYAGRIEPHTTTIPDTDYGKSKLTAETLFVQRSRYGIALRLGLLLGRSGGRGLRFFDALERSLWAGEKVSLREDLYHHWTLPSDLIFAIEKILEMDQENPKTEIVQLASKNSLSLFHFGECFAKALNLNTTELIQSCQGEGQWSYQWPIKKRALEFYNAEPVGDYTMDVSSGEELIGHECLTIEGMIQTWVDHWKNIWKESHGPLEPFEDKSEEDSIERSA